MHCSGKVSSEQSKKKKHAVRRLGRRGRIGNEPSAPRKAVCPDYASGCRSQPSGALGGWLAGGAVRRAPPRPPSAAAPPRIRRPCRRGASLPGSPRKDTAVAVDMAACPTPARNGRPFGNGRRGIFSCFFSLSVKMKKKTPIALFPGQRSGCCELCNCSA